MISLLSGKRFPALTVYHNHYQMIIRARETLCIARISRLEGRRQLKVVVCVRRVPDTAARIRIASDRKSIETSDAEFVINPYEEYALEQAVQLKEKHGGDVTVVTLGPEKSTQMIMKALALGADNAVHLRTEDPHSDPSSIAKAIANELKSHQFDILLFGKKGVDDDNQQVGQMVAELLDIPCVTQIVKLELSDGRAVRRGKWKAVASSLRRLSLQHSQQR